MLKETEKETEKEQETKPETETTKKDDVPNTFDANGTWTMVMAFVICITSFVLVCGKRSKENET